MALFPDVRFEVLLPDGGITAGQIASGILVVASDEAIPRADRIELELVSTVIYRRPMPAEIVLYRTHRRIALAGGIAAGVHRFPFSLDTPPNLSPSFHDEHQTILHAVRVRMDVAWARDPSVDAYPKVLLAPRTGERTPLRSPVDLELPDAEIELAVDSTVLVQGEPVLGSIRLRRGSLEPFQGLRLSIESRLSSTVAGNWARTHASVIVTDEQLRNGEPVAFELPGAENPSFQSDVLGHAVKIGISPHGDFVTFRTVTTLVPLEVLPRGSVITGAPEEGRDLRRRSARVAAATGLREGTGVVLVEGDPSGMRLRIRSLENAFEAELAYPQSAIGKTVFLQSKAAITDEDDLVDLARRAIAHAAELTASVRRLPFPASISEETADAWRACADATGAFLVPSIPSLDGLVFRRLLASQEERTFTASLRTAWTGDKPRDRVILQLGAARLPERIMAPLANGTFPDGLAALRRTFSAIHASSSGGVLVLDRPAWSADPRTLLPAIDAVVDWVMRERGEEQRGSPYR